MALFSERKGIRPLQKAIQRESMDEELRTRLWNALYKKIWSQWSNSGVYGPKDTESLVIEAVVDHIWNEYLKRPLDTCPPFDPQIRGSSYSELRNYFFSADWWQVFDFTGFVVQNFPADLFPDIPKAFNHVLETENSAYRVVNGEITEITDEQEIQSIETAFESPSLGARKHFENALKLLSDRKEPDYPNSIKESISAVESACRTVSGNPKATLGDCLKAIQKDRPLHPAFKEALNKLYGYTSDEGGIRHSLSDAPAAQLSYADAKFMLVTCTAFVNYLFTRAAEDSLPLSSNG